MTADRNNITDASQQGNVFFIILIGIVMFAAVMFTFSRGVRQGTENMDGRKAELAASEILSYAQKVRRGVERVLSRNISEADLSFANEFDTNYVNLSCTDNNCLVFHPDGGAVKWQDPPADANSGQPYFFGPNRVGSADGVTKDIGTSARDLVMLLPVNSVLCDSINAMTNEYSVWESDGAHNATTRFTGDYSVAAGTVIARGNNADQPATGCFCDGTAPCDAADSYFFYSVVLAR